ncbi:EscU/YscU/HrcU family type III secretion system export apparatus switch protein [Marinimicrobium sp. ABcell2]|uniref:EscU/YscU/HrcU family type III secretion system export apparatus switch protein n=1 Tax=Marinimicrobium sp. ABcell2 TaxID=3069751 RepID=UPI0027B6DF1C|nr:EscU/YscU/HrcU family type III secretion system export apparatus switch protein [Marinimicrobium sp. ABcell2]MDQ2077851.1 EscU/YscU/HrcU family type III secretion system export apparatus switch protein [Marinimicrobium sp. ABcell2]
MTDNSFTEEEINKAVALFYDGSQTPYVSAKGTGEIAREIVAIAEAEGVPLCDNSALVDLLVTLELGDEIPETLYIAVAYIIAFAYQLRGKVPDS